LILDLPAPKPSTARTKGTESDDIFALHDRSQPKPPKKAKPANGRGRRGRGRGSRPRGAKTKSSEDYDLAEKDANNANDDEEPEASEQMAPETPSGGTQKPIEASEPLKPAEIQIVGIGHCEPVISYEGNIYSCQWATSIGSDLLFAKSTLRTDPDREVLHSLDSWDLLGIASAKLIASHANLLPRRFEMVESHSNTATQTPAVTETGLSTLELAEEERLQQFDFLKRFAEIKARKGEASEHTLTTLQGTTNAQGVVTPSGRGRGRGNVVARRHRRARTAPSLPRLQGVDVARRNAFQHLQPAVLDSTPSTWGDMGNSQQFSLHDPNLPPPQYAYTAPYIPPEGSLLPNLPDSGSMFQFTPQESAFPTFSDYPNLGNGPAPPSVIDRSLTYLPRSTQDEGEDR
jgi:hypothetical protein